MPTINNPVLLPGSRVLVTGVSGFIGSHIADQLLSEGYLVTGTTRDISKLSWLQTLFDGKYGEGKFGIVQVHDIANSGAIDHLFHGISGIVHAASDMTMDPDPNKVITPMVAGTLSLLNAAAKQSSVKRFVLTSSCAAAATAKPGVAQAIDTNTWNDEVSREAWAPPPYGPERSFAVYAASKMEMEREAWKWHAEHKPQFVLNTVLPSMNFGKSLDPVNQGHPSTSFMVQAVFQGNATNDVCLTNAPDFFVDVQDNARLHIAALIHPGVQGERIFAYAQPYTWRGIQDAIRGLYPSKSFAGDIEHAKLDASHIVAAPRAEELLKEMGQEGWSSLEETVRMNVEDLA
ncbi:uncharacterized protein B0H64DRAFT_451721 [Chaetomium fimeti]|uniref:NAD-dependent epimerase/dehydratase domain-containing protein n=1 Tax=Chaetomium fimeti TaxID=1854472 RepID=A0AAE0H6W5_9PEZI|nr:hypothetical protein B0H64DRAFT_451721 [Chaetomium fimeti]